MATHKTAKAEAIKGAEKLGHDMTPFDTGVADINTASCKNCGAEISVDQDDNTPYQPPWGNALEEQCPGSGAGNTILKSS